MGIYREMNLFVLVSLSLAEHEFRGFIDVYKRMIRGQGQGLGSSYPDSRQGMGLGLG